MSREGIRKSLVILLAFTLAAAARAEGSELGPSQWRDELAEVDAKLDAGKWKAAGRGARKLAEEILFHGWHDRELGRILAELALYQAVASANLGRRDEALWYWDMAQNLDFRIRKRDLTPYGETGELLREFPLRRQGRASPGFQLAEPRYGRFSRAVMEPGWAPVVPYNSGEQAERPGDLHLELIVDRHGQAHHPVLLTPDLHPVVIYGLLDALRTMPRFQPAHDTGEPVDSLFKYIVSPTYTRWDQGGKTLRGTIQNR